MKSYKLIISLLALTFFLGSCKVKEAAGPYRPAEDTKKVEQTATIKQNTESQKVSEPESTGPNKVRTESFKLVEGEDATALKTYSVVIGSFKNRANAQGLQSLMKANYAPMIVVNDEGMFRVLLVSYDDYLSAKQKIVEIKSQFDDAWVLVPKQ